MNFNCSYSNSWWTAVPSSTSPHPVSSLAFVQPAIPQHLQKELLAQLPQLPHTCQRQSCLQQSMNDSGASPLAVVTKELFGTPVQPWHSCSISRHHTASLLTQPTSTLRLPSPLQLQSKEERAIICQKCQNQRPGRWTQLNDAELFSSRELQGRSPNPTPINQPIYPMPCL